MTWPDLQLLAVTHLTDTVGVRVVTQTPSDLESEMPLIRARRGPGSDDGISDSPLLDVDAFAASEQAAWDLAESARQSLLALTGKAVGGVLVDTVSTATGPVAVDWGNPGVQRFVASYRITLRR